MGWGGRSHVPSLLVRRGLGVPEMSVEIIIWAILRMKVRVLRNYIEIRRLEYGRGTGVTSLFGCCVRRATKPCEAEETGSLV